MGALLPEDGQAYLPFLLGQIKIYSQFQGDVWSHIAVRQEGGRSSGTVSADIRLFDQAGRLIAEINELTLRRSKGGVGECNALKDCLYEMGWQPLNDPFIPMTALAGDWLIFIDDHGIGVKLSQALTEMGNNCILVRQGEAFQVAGINNYILDPTQSEDFIRLLNEAGKSSFRGVLYCWSLDIPFPTPESPSQEGIQEIFCGGGLHLAQASVKHGVELKQGLWLVTHRVFHIQGAQDDTQVFPAGATLWGLGKVIAQEHPELHCRCIDLDIAAGDEVKRSLMAVISSSTDEDQMAIRNGQFYVPRLIRSTIAEKGKIDLSGGRGAL